MIIFYISEWNLRRSKIAGRLPFDRPFDKLRDHSGTGAAYGSSSVLSLIIYRGLPLVSM